MNPQTFDIKDFTDSKTAIAAGYTVPLTKQEAELLRGMNRKQRRKWMVNRRREQRKAKAVRDE